MEKALLILLQRRHNGPGNPQPSPAQPDEWTGTAGREPPNAREPRHSYRQKTVLLSVGKSKTCRKKIDKAVSGEQGHVYWSPASSRYFFRFLYVFQPRSSSRHIFWPMKLRMEMARTLATTQRVNKATQLSPASLD